MALNISSDLVPQVINDYNAYTEDDLLIGLADEVTLPKIKNKTTTVNGMGIAGDVDSPVPGQFESMEATLNWNTMYSFATKMMNPNKNIQITLRAAMQNDNKNGGYTYKGLRVVLGGRPKELDPGKLKRADTMGSTTTLEVTRYLMRVLQMENLKWKRKEAQMRSGWKRRARSRTGRPMPESWMQI